ncbi:RING finger protein 207-like [Littorina saxatilis]|uniref:RING finger protein 207 n=1 Tax=Littorina saxatilis TaxID=31220 RepID=A0AAN9AVK7_9CAEN
MSGEIFHPMENLEEVDSKKWNPLQCPLCNEPYENPCILTCFHSFCERCLRGRDVDSKMTCPVCGVTTHIKDGGNTPPHDPLLKFMVESTTDEKAPCANCDSSDTSGGMFYCNTCCQPLCTKCRDDTHRARMFAAHDIVLMTKRTRDIHKRCSLHGEPYIMFSMEKKIMLCINCFRDMRIESRTHCVDLETAYNQSCKKLDHSVQAIRDLQHSVRDGILLLRALLDEIKQNADKERHSLLELYEAIMLKMEQTKDMLVEEVDSQFHEKEKTFKAQLKTLTHLLPTLHVHLVMSLAFSSSTNKFEFLDLAYVMMDRLKTIVQRQHPLHPTQSGQIDTGHKTQFAKSLEPLLFVPQQHRPPVPGLNGRGDLSAALPPAAPHTSKSPSANTPVTNMSPVTARRSNGLNGAKVKFIDAKGPFADHCVEFETAHREVIQKFEKLKGACQELQRDVTMRRCLAKKDEIQRLQERIEGLQLQLTSHFATLDTKQAAMEKHWEESLQRIANEQDLYQAQLQDVDRLKQESERLRVITGQLTSFVSSIAAVTERLAPKLNHSTQSLDQDNSIMMLFEEINAMNPDSQHRVEAIRDVEEERQTKTANRTNPLDSELIKTKGMLKAPSVRDRRDSGGGAKKDNSAAPAAKEELSEAADSDTSAQEAASVSVDTE